MLCVHATLCKTVEINCEKFFAGNSDWYVTKWAYATTRPIDRIERVQHHTPMHGNRFVTLKDAWRVVCLDVTMWLGACVRRSDQCPLQNWPKRRIYSLVIRYISTLYIYIGGSIRSKSLVVSSITWELLYDSRLLHIKNSHFFSSFLWIQTTNLYSNFFAIEVRSSLFSLIFFFNLHTY